MKAAIRPFVPPILLERPRSGPTAGAAPASTAYYDFSDPFPTWADAVAASGGYDDPDILRRVRAAALKAKRGEIAYEQDSLEFAEPSPKWEMLACLMTALANSMNRPGHIIDFGGSLGTLYYRHRDFVRGVCWSIVEQPGFVKCGKAEFADQTLGFFSSVGEALERAPGDVLLVGCTLQVLEDPFAPIRQAAAAGVSLPTDRPSPALRHPRGQDRRPDRGKRLSIRRPTPIASSPRGRSRRSLRPLDMR
jgi:hypothetical protein